MTEETERTKKSVNINLFPPLTVAVFILLALTGNCRTCGFDRDYVGDVIDARRGEQG